MTTPDAAPPTPDAARLAVAAAREAAATAREAVATALLTSEWVGGIVEAQGLLGLDRQGVLDLLAARQARATRDIREWRVATREEIAAIEAAQHDLRVRSLERPGETTPGDQWMVATESAGLRWCGVERGRSYWRSCHTPTVRAVGII